MKSLQWYEWLAVFILIFVFLKILHLMWKDLKDGLKPSPNDELHQLNWRIEYATLTEHSELYLITRIKELRQRPDIDQEALSGLYVKFVRRFGELHIADEHSPESMDLDITAKLFKLRKDLEKEEYDTKGISK